MKKLACRQCLNASVLMVSLLISLSEWLICALFGFKWLIILAMSLLEKFIESRHFLVSSGRFVGKTLLLLKKQHRFTKIWLKNSAFSLITVMNVSSWKRGGMQEIFLLFKNVFNID